MKSILPNQLIRLFMDEQRMLAKNRHRRRLSLQRLEDRCLLAIASFEFELLEDTGSGPGTALESNELTVGDSFYLAINTVEYHPSRSGLSGIGLDIDWEAAHFELLSDSETVSDSITDHLPLFRQGTVDHENGSIINLAASELHGLDAGRPIGDGQFEQFAALHFKSIASAESSEFTMTTGEWQIATFPASSLSLEDINFDVEVLNIVEGETFELPLPNSDTEPSVSIARTGEPTDQSTQPETDNSAQSETLAATDRSQDASQTTAETHDSHRPVSLAFVTETGVSSSSTFKVGDQIEVHVTVEEQDPETSGVGGLSVDVTWDPEVLKLAEAGPVTDTITDAFPVFRTGEVDAGAGRIDDLSAASFESTGLGHAIGDGQAETFASLTFEAVGPAESTSVAVALGDGGIGLVGDTSGDVVSVASAQTSLRVATAVLPPMIQVSTSGASGMVEFGTTKTNGQRSAWIRPGLVDSLQHLEISNIGEMTLEVYEIQIGVEGLTISDPEAKSGFSVEPGQTRRVSLAYEAAVDLEASDSIGQNANNAIVVLSNADNRAQFPVAAGGQTTFRADITLDGRVSIADVVLLDTVFGQTKEDSAYSQIHDPNLDGSIDLGDFGLLNAQFGLRYIAQEASSVAAAYSSDGSDGDDDLENSIELIAQDLAAKLLS